jgi:Ca2+-dependent lipid-binding protein
MTKVQRRTLNPVWHFDCKFHVQDPSRDTLHVSLFDASVPADELIGSLSIPLAQCSLRSTNISLDQDVIGNTWTAGSLYFCNLCSDDSGVALIGRHADQMQSIQEERKPSGIQCETGLATSQVSVRSVIVNAA